MRDCARQLAAAGAVALNFPHPEERALARVSKDGPRAPWFSRRCEASSGAAQARLLTMRRRPLQHRQAARLWPARKGLVERRNLIAAEYQFAGSGVFGGVLFARGFWNRKDRGRARQEGQRDLA